MRVDFNVRDNRGWTFSLEEVFLWIMDSILAILLFSQKQRFEVKNVLTMDLFLTSFSLQDINW